MIKKIIRMIAILAMTSTQASTALACACCADPGGRYERSDVLSDWDFSELQRLRSDGVVEIHYTDCGEDCIFGIAPIDEWHNSTILVGLDGVTLTLASKQSELPSVTLIADAPEKFSWLATDPAPGSRGVSPGGLYSETILPLTMQGAGPSWTGGTNSFHARLILIGQSTACMEMSRNTHWMLDVETEDITFRLFGKFASPA